MSIPFPGWFIEQHKISTNNIYGFFLSHTETKNLSQFIVTHISSLLNSSELKRTRKCIFSLFLLGFSLDPVNPFNPFLGSKASLAFISGLLAPRHLASGHWLRVFHVI